MTIIDMMNNIISENEGELVWDKLNINTYLDLYASILDKLSQHAE